MRARAYPEAPGSFKPMKLLQVQVGKGSCAGGTVMSSAEQLQLKGDCGDKGHAAGSP